MNAVVLAAVGEEVVLACEASGVPPPRVIWYRGTLGGGRGPGGSAFQDGRGGHSEWGVWRERTVSGSPTPIPRPASTQLMQVGSVVRSRM